MMILVIDVVVVAACHSHDGIISFEKSLFQFLFLASLPPTSSTPRCLCSLFCFWHIELAKNPTLAMNSLHRCAYVSVTLCVHVYEYEWTKKTVFTLICPLKTRNTANDMQNWDIFYIQK